MRIGDNVRGQLRGIVTDIKTRYTVIRSLAGRESIVPNEMIITSRVENLSWQTRVSGPPRWSRCSRQRRGSGDVPLLLGGDAGCERVLRDPSQCGARNFGADGLEFTVGYWIADPQNG